MSATPSVKSTHIGDQAALANALKTLSREDDPLAKALIQMRRKGFSPEEVAWIQRPEAFFTDAFFSEDSIEFLDKVRTFFKGEEGPEVRLNRLLRKGRLSRGNLLIKTLDERINHFSSQRVQDHYQKASREVATIAHLYTTFKTALMQNTLQNRLKTLMGPALLYRRHTCPVQLSQKQARKLCSVGRFGQLKKQNPYGASAVAKYKNLFIKRSSNLKPGEEYLVKSFSLLLSNIHGSAAITILKIQNIWIQNPTSEAHRDHPLRKRYVTKVAQEGALPPKKLLEKFFSAEERKVYPFTYDRVSYPLQASIEVSGDNLREFIENGEDLNQITQKSATLQLLLALLFRLGDARSDNSMVTQRNRHLISIDSDTLWQPYFNSAGGQHFLIVRSTVFLLPHMNRPADPEILRKLKQKSPLTLLMGWLTDIDQKNKEYQTLQTEGVLSSSDMNELDLPIHITWEDLSYLHTQLDTLQTFLKNSPAPTLWDITTCLTPPLTPIYQALSKKAQAEGILAIESKLFQKHDIPSIETLTNPTPATLEHMQALEFPTYRTKGRPLSIPELTVRYLSKQPLIDLKPEEEQTILGNIFPITPKVHLHCSRIKDPQLKRYVIRNKTEELTLTHCLTLTGKGLLDLLPNAPSLTNLSLSLPQLNPKEKRDLERYCKNHQKTLTFIEPQEAPPPTQQEIPAAAAPVPVASPAEVPPKPLLTQITETFQDLPSPDKLLEDKLQNPHMPLTLDQSIALLLECIRQGKLEAQKAQDKEVILFIGNTGAGKSTTVNYLCGCTLEMIPYRKLGIPRPRKAVIVKPPEAGGARAEVMPIGHAKQSKTFMPQIEEDGPNTYMDCPGFLDNRGVEINIANAVNIKNAIKESKTAKVIILINYHSLEAARGRGLTEMLQIAYNLFGNKKNLLEAKDSLLIGVTNALLDVDLEDLRDFIVEDNPTLAKLKDRIFTYDPLDRELEGAWKRDAFLDNLKTLKPVPNHKKIFSTVLTDADENKLLHISEALGERIQKALNAQDYPQAASHYRHLRTLNIIDHHTLERLFQTQQRALEAHAYTQVTTFNTACHLENFNQAKKYLIQLQKALEAFQQELSAIIKPHQLQTTYNTSLQKQQTREAQFKAYQQEIRDANKKIDEFIKLIDAQKAQMETQLTEQEENYKKLLASLSQNYNQKLQNLETAMQELRQEEELRLAKKEEELKVAEELKDQENKQKLQEERKKLQETYEQKFAKATQEKEKLLLQQKELLRAQQEAHTQKQREIAKQISALEAQKVQQQKLQKGAIPEMAFGKAKWEKHFGDIGVEPPLPPNIEEILNSPCPFWPDKKVRETHLLVLIPETVNGKPFHLDALGQMIKAPKTGHKTQYEYYADKIKKELGKKGEKSHWVLMTRDVIPGSRNKSYGTQKTLAEKHAGRNGVAYKMPKALEAATAILMEHASTGTRLYSNASFTYTRCQEKVDQFQWPAAIGGLTFFGLNFSNDNYGNDCDYHRGVAACGSF